MCVSVIEETEYFDQVVSEQTGEEERNIDSYMKGKINLGIEQPRLEPKESIEDVHINPDLSHEKQEQLRALVREFPDVLTDLPGRTSVTEHEIKLTSDYPVRSKPYPVPHALKDTIKAEVDCMLKMEIITPIDSPYASPVVIVKKSDGSNRFCIDYRKLNRITQFDAEPIEYPDEIFFRLSKGRFFSKLDLSKGYWQIPVKRSSQSATAFITSEGLYAFQFMPFGLENSGATFCRMM